MAMRKFDNRNALIEDPLEYIQEEKKLRPWMPEERRIFNEKFLAHPKARCAIGTLQAFNADRQAPMSCSRVVALNQRILRSAASPDHIALFGTMAGKQRLLVCHAGLQANCAVPGWAHHRRLRGALLPHAEAG